MRIVSSVVTGSVIVITLTSFSYLNMWTSYLAEYRSPSSLSSDLSSLQHKFAVVKEIFKNRTSRMRLGKHLYNVFLSNSVRTEMSARVGRC